jgi:putative hydrolase of the HAD superfamily
MLVPLTNLVRISSSMLADLFFDLDRTLWDFDRNSREALRLIFEEYAQPEVPAAVSVEEFIRVYERQNERCWSAYQAGQMTQAELRPTRFRKTLEALGVDATAMREDLAHALGQAYVERSPFLPHLIPGAMELVERLKAKGHRLFIITNGFEEVQHIKMKRSGLEPHFEAVYTSDALGHKKPAPEAFLASLRAAGSRVEDAVMIGDDLECDVVGARAIGMRSVHFNPRSQSHREQVWRTVTDLGQILELPLTRSSTQMT